MQKSNRAPIISLLLTGVFACSSGGLQDGGVPDGGWRYSQDAAPASDLATAADLHPPADLGTLPDPATCPVGKADGCCPLLRYGGSDPDCPKLDCAKLDQSAPIALDPPAIGAGWAGAGQVGLAWTGRELALAWNFTSNELPREYKVLFERRQANGDLSYGPVTSMMPSVATPVASGPTALAYEPSRRAYLLGHTTTGRHAAVGLDEAGMAQWGLGLGSVCGYSPQEAFSTGSRWVLGQGTMTCAGAYQPQVDSMDFDGGNPHNWMIGDGARSQITPNAAFAYDPTSNKLLTIYSRFYELTMGARFLDLNTDTLQPGLDLRKGTLNPYEGLGLAFDGQRYGVVFEERPSYSSFVQYFQLYDPKTGWVDSPVQFATPRAILPPSVVWTGDGFLVAMMTFSGPDLPGLDAVTSVVYSFAPDGKLRESFPVEIGATAYPKLMWAGGRVALTWSRVVPGGTPTAHVLRYLSCP